MAGLKSKTLLLGEGPTEFYYFNSLKDDLKGIQIKPDYPKHTNMKELEAKIKEGIELGYQKIFCVIDMDNKDEKGEHDKYMQLKRRYAEPIVKPKKGIDCTVRFFETHRCTELFFLYYFRYTSKYYANQPDLLKDLQRFCPEYEKEQKFFSKCLGLHSYFTKKGGSLGKAIDRAQKSMREKSVDGRDYTYSQLGEMMIELSNSDV